MVTKYDALYCSYLIIIFFNFLNSTKPGVFILQVFKTAQVQIPPRRIRDCIGSVKGDVVD